MKTENDNSISGVAETNVTVLGNATAMGMGNIVSVNAHAIGLLFEQQITQQRNDYELSNSNMVKSIDKILNGPLTLKDKILSKK